MISVLPSGVEMPCLHGRLFEIAVKMSGKPIDLNEGEDGRYPSFGVPLHKSPAVLAALCDIGKEKLADLQSTSTLSLEPGNEVEPCKGQNYSAKLKVSPNTKVQPPRKRNLSKTSYESSLSRFHPYQRHQSFVPINVNFEDEKQGGMRQNSSWHRLMEAEPYYDDIKKSFSSPGQLHTRTNTQESSVYDRMHAFSVHNLAQSCTRVQSPFTEANLPTVATTRPLSTTTPSRTYTIMSTSTTQPTPSVQVQPQRDNFRKLMLPFGDVRATLTDTELLRQRRVARSLALHGLCVVDGLLGAKISSKIREEVLQLHARNDCMNGALIGSKQGNSAIRGDVITWIDGTEPHCESIGVLCRTMDRIVAMGTGIAPAYRICGGTKLMVAKYPGRGTQYKLHVDNPAKDGRCITCTYFCNKDWDTNTMGGTLRVHSASGNTTNVSPEIDRVAIFYSDSRTPHEVLPCYKDRYAITLWYFDRDERAKALKRIDQKRTEHMQSKAAGYKN